MAQSLADVLIHLVFSTKNREPLISPSAGARLHPYFGATLRNVGCPPIEIGGVADHVHLLFRLDRKLAIAEVAEKVKTSSSKWMKGHVPGFAWQAGYGAFSVGSRDRMGLVAYIRNQEAHHRKVSFQDELRALLREAGMEVDERYLWD
jgi:putative transposase